MNVRTLLAVSRPRFWLYTAGPVLVGAAFAGPAALTPLMLAIFAWFLIPANVFLYGVNDLADKDTDRYNPKKGAKEHRHREHEAFTLAVVIALCLALFVPVAMLVTWQALVFFSLFLLLGAAYSLPPLRFKARPLIDAASNALYAMPGLGAYALAAGELPSVAAMIAAFAWTAAMHWFSAVPDIEADARAGLSTSAVVFGRTGSLIAVSLLWMLALAAAFAARLPLFALAAGLVYPILPLLLLNASGQAVERAYWRFPWINAVVGMILFFAAVSLYA